MSIARSLCDMDESHLNQFFKVIGSALNDYDTIKRVAEELDLDPATIMVYSALAAELASGEESELTATPQFNRHVNDIAVALS